MQSKERLRDIPPTYELRRDGSKRTTVVDPIDRQLRLNYSALVAEPMPPEISSLLDALEQNSERKRRAS